MPKPKGSGKWVETKKASDVAFKGYAPTETVAGKFRNMPRGSRVISRSKKRG